MLDEAIGALGMGSHARPESPEQVWHEALARMRELNRQVVNRDRVHGVEIRDLTKMRDVLRVAVAHHRARDEMNASLHLAASVRYSPLTTELETILELVARYEADAL